MKSFSLLVVNYKHYFHYALVLMPKFQLKFVACIENVENILITKYLYICQRC